MSLSQVTHVTRMEHGIMIVMILHVDMLVGQRRGRRGYDWATDRQFFFFFFVLFEGARTWNDRMGILMSVKGIWLKRNGFL